jgi:membrane-associated phospholipid phosphatase
MIQSPDAAAPELTRMADEPRFGARVPWWLLPAVLVAGFVFLLWQVKTHGPVTGLDIRVRDRLQDLAGKKSLHLMFHPARAAADLGNQSVALTFLFAFTALAARATRSWRPVFVSLGAAAALLTVIPLKLWIDRPGPGMLVLGDAALGYFPSGHTADAILCYGTSALLVSAFVIPPGPAGRSTRWVSAILAAALVFLTIFGLLWSDFHWLSDTLGSLCWCGAALAVLHRVAFHGVAFHRLVPGEGNSARPPLA